MVTMTTSSTLFLPMKTLLGASQVADKGLMPTFNDFG